MKWGNKKWIRMKLMTFSQTMKLLVLKALNLKKALKPLDDVFDGFGDDDDDNTNLKRFNELNSVDKHKVLNLEIF